jgi:GNAT superfamily N-acetyltransferase
VHEVLGWFEDDKVRGAIEIYYQDDRAEAGLTLEEAWRGRGIGTELVRHAMRRAGSHGARSLAMPFNRSNKSMTEIAAMLSSPQSFGHWRKAETTEANASMRTWIDFDIEDPGDEPAAGGLFGKVKSFLSRLRGDPRNP